MTLASKQRPAAGRPLQLVRVAACDWRVACLREHEAGHRFDGLFGGGAGDGATQLRAVFDGTGADRVLECEVRGQDVATIVDEVPAAAWHEREIHDLHGVRFAGHEPLRPLLDHDAPLEAWTVPTVGEGTHQVAVGPVHAGVIESGHFRFHVVGERILHLDLRLFYKRRGLEAAAAGQPIGAGIAYAQRACAACSVANSVAYAHACEAALGLAPDRELRRIRTLLLELERIYNHLHDISAICAGVGFAPGNMAYAALKERVQRVNGSLAGHRFLFGSIQVGAGDLHLDGALTDPARAELRAVSAEHATIWRQLQLAVSLQERLGEIGVLSAEDAARFGAVGPSARAAGLRHDARQESPRLWYGGAFHPVTAPDPVGDVAARFGQRAAELEQSFAIADELLEQPLPEGSTSSGFGDGGSLGVGRVEGPRGRTVCLVERTGLRVRSLHLRTASYANWPALAHAVTGDLLPDFPLINKSFELCYACVDR